MNVFTYRARLDRVVDGDTYDMVVDLGFHITRTVRVRLKGVDTAEIYGVEMESDEYARGTKQADAVQQWFSHTDDESGWPYRLTTSKSGKYGRYLGDVFVPVSRDPPDGYERHLHDYILAEWPGATYDG